MPFEHIFQALEWINNIASTKTKHISKEQKLVSIRTILDLLGNPQKYFKSIHITGSKGKSTTAYACAHFINQSPSTTHHKTGLFTSPHIHSYNERIRIDNHAIDDESLLSAFNIIHTLSISHKISLTMFEILCASACLIFKHEKVEYAIFEVGIGGRYDTTNFLHPILSIITNIEYEHQDILGHSIEEIAYDKAGIIKSNTPVWITKQKYPKTIDVLIDYAKKNTSPYVYLPDHLEITKLDNIHARTQKFKLSPIHKSPHSQKTNLNIYPRISESIITSPTISEVIAKNQIYADVITHNLLSLEMTPIRNYNEDILLICRSELLKSKKSAPLFLDGAHTTLSISEALHTIGQISNNNILVLSLSKGKNYIEIVKKLSNHKDIINTIIITRAGTFRTSEAKKILHIISKEFPHTKLIEQETEAIRNALYMTQLQHNDSMVCVLGSFYLCAICREWYIKTQSLL